MTTTTDKPAADPLDLLTAQAVTLESGAGEGDAPGAPGEEQAPEQLSNEQVFGGAIATAREAFCLFTKLQSPRAVLDDSAVQQLAALWAPVLEKHGINLSDYIGDYALELTAAVGTISIAYNLRKAVSAEIALLKKDESTGVHVAPGADDGNADTQS